MPEMGITYPLPGGISPHHGTMQADIERILGRLESSVASSNERLARIEALLEAQNGRVRKLEVWQGWMLGALAALGTLLGVLMKVVT